LQISFRREGDRMDQQVEAPPFPCDRLEERIQFPRLGHVERRRNAGFEFSGERFNLRPRFFVEPSYREIGPGGTKCLCAAVSDRLIVGDSDNKRFTSGKDGIDFGFDVSASGRAHRRLIAAILGE
jgi:hypothetical protein